MFFGAKACTTYSPYIIDSNNNKSDNVQYFALRPWQALGKLITTIIDSTHYCLMLKQDLLTAIIIRTKRAF